MQPKHILNFGRRHYDEHSREIILIKGSGEDAIYRKFSKALADPLFSGAGSFVQF